MHTVCFISKTATIKKESLLANVKNIIHLMTAFKAVQMFNKNDSVSWYDQDNVLWMENTKNYH